MSGIFGTYSRSSNARSLDVFGRIQESMLYWTPDRHDECLRQYVCLGQLTRETTPEDRYDRQPVEHRVLHNEWLLVADVRLDNREELLASLGGDELLAGRDPGTVPDSEILLAAYRKWGEGCCEKLLGDFVFAIWNAEKGELFCARDHMGVRPFYFMDDGDLFCFANDIRGLAAAANNGLDARAVASYLRNGELLDEDLSFLAGVEKLPPASFLRVSAGERTLSRYWRYEDVKSLEPDSFANYAARLRGIVEDAVRVRLRRIGPLSCHLSGGLDSSVVTAVAAGLDDPGDMLTFNWVHPPGADDDTNESEWANARETARQLGVSHEEVALSLEDVRRYVDDADLAMHDTSDAFYEGRVRVRSAERGARVILSGWGGDELISNSGRRRYSDEFMRGRLASALGGIRSSAGTRRGRVLGFAAACYREVLRPLLGWLVPPNISTRSNYAGCATADIARLARKPSGFRRRHAELSVRGEQMALLRQGHLQNRTESWANAGRQDGIEYRYPLLDKRVVEYALALPACAYREGKIMRRIMRELAKDLLPVGVLENQSKLEKNRTHRLLEFLELACRQSIDAGLGGPGGVENRELIDTNRLRRLAGSLGESGSEDFKSRAMNCMTVYRSLLVLRAGRSLSAV